LFVLAESMNSWFASLFPAQLILVVAGPEEEEEPSGESPPPDSDPLSDQSFTAVGVREDIGL